MANDENEDEFRFEDTQIESAGHLSKNPFGDVRPSALMDMISKKRVIIVGIVALVVMLGYKLVGVFIETRKNYQTEPPKAQAQLKPKKIVKTEPPIAPVAAPIKIDTTAADQQKMQQLETKVSGLQADIGSLNTNIEHLTQVISEQQQYIQTMQEVLKEKDKKSAKKKSVFIPHYSVKAMIPGRAWLIEDGKPNTLTVTYGDNLPGHGRIKNIDAAAGSIETTSGTIIQFGEDDR